MTVRESPSDIRRKSAALLLVFSVFAMAFAILRLPVPAPQQVTVPRPAAYVGANFSRPITVSGPALTPDVLQQAAPPAAPSIRPANRRPVTTPMPPSSLAPPDAQPAVTVAAPIVAEPPAAAFNESPSAEEPLPSRLLRFDAQVPSLASAQPAADLDGSGIGAAGHAVGRAFGIAGRQIVTAFRRTGDAVKGAF